MRSWCIVLSIAIATMTALADDSIRRVYIEDISIRDSSCVFNLPDCNAGFTAEICGSVDANKDRPGMSPASWSATWQSSGSDYSIELKMEWGNREFGSPFDARFLKLTGIETDRSGAKNTVISQHFEKGVNLNEGNNTMVCVVVDSVMRVYLGNNYVGYVGQFPISDYPDKVKLTSTGKTDFDYFVFESSDSRDLSTSWCRDSLDRVFDVSQNWLEGYWEYLDRDNDTDYARLGGNYTLAIVASETPGVYNIIYVSGARTNSHLWHEGMLKGQIKETQFTDRYELYWYDSERTPVDSEIYALTEGKSLLTFNFPVLKSKFRFMKRKL